MEKWNEVFVGEIPYGIYQTRLTNGEEEGLVIKLLSKQHVVRIIFGMVQAVRMLDEGIVQTDLYLDEAMIRFKKEEFKNTIYEVINGEFLKQIKNFSSGYAEVLNLKHYIIITQNYNVEVISKWKPEIEVFGI